MSQAQAFAIFGQVLAMRVLAYASQGDRQFLVARASLAFSSLEAAVKVDTKQQRATTRHIPPPW